MHEKKIHKINIDVRSLPEGDPRKPEWDMLQRVGLDAIISVMDGLRCYTGGRLTFGEGQQQIISAELEQMESAFLTDLLLSNVLAKRTLRNNGRPNLMRVSAVNGPMKRRLDEIKKLSHKTSVLWMAGNILNSTQSGGLKKVAMAGNGNFGDDIIHDLATSAATGRLGFGNPYPLIMKTADSLMQTSGHPMHHYHPAEVQGYAMDELAKLHPNTKQVENQEIRIHTRHSGSEINSTAIEIVCAHAAERQHTYESPEVSRLLKKYNLKGANGIKQLELRGLITVPKVFAVDGTWAGGYGGAATEGSAWGVDGHSNLHTGGEAWVKRVLPIFTAENREKILTTLSEAIKRGECAGLIIEPDVDVDGGMYPVDQALLTEVRNLFEPHELPIIADCMQTTGSVGGSYFGEGPTRTLADYQHLIITNAKAAAIDPYAFALIPAHIDDSTTGMSHLSTPTNYGPHLQALVIAHMVQNEEFQAKVERDGQRIREIAEEYGMADRLRGKGMNRAWIVEDTVRAQNFLYLQYGILLGKASGILRDQRSLTEFSETHEFLTRIICQGLKRLEEGNLDQETEEVLQKMRLAGEGGL
ncbi:MAG: hypothetical protein US38_C0006G0091 [Candidatus Roizmanbacteria bacterium GW2011_GWC1_37_12]|nr:MAG: hypothetical protein US38_C0006G0091 [Candidatus Roizmanbacteria bacterium GW2011_GWC1_37_12]